MSCSLWRWAEICDHRPCVGDCDLCDYPDEEDDENFYRIPKNSHTVSFTGKYEPYNGDFSEFYNLIDKYINRFILSIKTPILIGTIEEETNENNLQGIHLRNVQ